MTSGGFVKAAWATPISLVNLSPRMYTHAIEVPTCPTISTSSPGFCAACNKLQILLPRHVVSAIINFRSNVNARAPRRFPPSGDTKTAMLLDFLACVVLRAARSAECTNIFSSRSDREDRKPHAGMETTMGCSNTAERILLRHVQVFALFWVR